MSDRVAQYIPVAAGPLRIQAGLVRLGTDFGNGAADGRVFQGDRLTPMTLKLKRELLDSSDRVRCWLDATTTGEQRRLRAVLGWMWSRLAEEAGEALESGAIASTWGRRGLTDGFNDFACRVTEDFVVMLRGAAPGQERATLVHVCFPSNWPPESIVGRSFLGTHEPVPEFEPVARVADNLVNAIVERGPYVRFVWTVTPDPRLDHHPETWRAESSARTERAYLRVERQVTVPLVTQHACLFVIRTHLYPVGDLTREQRGTLKNALSNMPARVRSYKGLDAAMPHVERLLGWRPQRPSPK